jgi:hypothetical protein
MKIGFVHQHLQEENEQTSKRQTHLDKQDTQKGGIHTKLPDIMH